MSEPLLDRRCVRCWQELTDRPHYCDRQNRKNKKPKRKPDRARRFAIKLEDSERPE